MSKANSQQFRLIFLLLVLGALFMAVRLIGNIKPPTQVPLATQPFTASPPVVVAKEAQREEIPQADRNFVPTSRDPFRVPNLLQETIRTRETQAKVPVEGTGSSIAQPPQPMPTLKLQGIFFIGSKPEAIINRQVVSEGDSIEGAKVVKVAREGVTVSFGGREVLLELTQRGSEGEGGLSGGLSPQVRQPY